jgi:hypothetical protein
MEATMLRWILPIALVMATAGTGLAADQALPRHYTYRTAGLPAGLPRPHYRYRTTITYAAPYLGARYYGRPLPVYDPPEVLFTPYDGYIPYGLPVVGVIGFPPYGCGPYGYYC